MASPGAAGGDQARPNVLVIVTDDQRAGSFSLKVMPNVRRWFVRDGKSFTRAYTTTPLCCPARASLLTGRYAHNHGVQTNYDPAPLEARSTLPRYLKLAGYRTAIAGKYLNSWPVDRDPPHFDRWATEDAYRYYDTRFNLDGRIHDVGGYSTSFISDRAVAFLDAFEKRDDEPWFLYVAPLAPHEPFTAEPRYEGARVPTWSPNPAVHEKDRSDKPTYVRNQNVPASYAAESLPRSQLRTLMSVDDLVGDIFGTLDDLGETQDTVAFYVSDNGYTWGEHGLAEKRVPYAGSIRIPLYVRWPGHVDAGTESDRITANVDLFPSILEVARLSLGAIDGRSIFASGSPRSELLIEYWRDPARPDIPTWASVLANDYQYVEYYGDGGVVAREYYDLVADPWQLRNLLGDEMAANDPDVSALHRDLARLRRCRGRSCP